MHVKNIPQNVKMGDKIRVENGAEKDKNGPIERFDNLRKNKGFGEVLHVKNVAEKEEIGTKKKNWCQKQRTRCEPKRQIGSH